MDRICLTKTERQVLLYVKVNGKSQPRNVTPVMFHYCLSTLREKGLVWFKSNYSDILGAGLTVKGAASMEQNPKLRNPIDWKWVITLITTSVTAIAATLALFVACNKI